MAGTGLSMIGKLGINTQLAVFIASDKPLLFSYERAREIAGDHVIVLVDVRCEEVFTNPCLQVIRRLSNAFLSESHVIDVKSFTHSVVPVRRGYTFEFEPFVASSYLSEFELRRLKEFSLNHPLVRNVMVSSDSRHSTISITYQREVFEGVGLSGFHDQIDFILETHRSGVAELEAASLPFVEEEIRRGLERDIITIVPAAFLTVLFVTAVFFRSWRLLAFIWLNMMLFALLFPGLIFLARDSLSLLSIHLIPLVCGLQITLLTHVGSAFRHAQRQTSNTDDAIQRMLDRIFKSCFFATLTTVAGLLALSLGDNDQVRDFGILGSIGVASGFLLLFGPGLALLKMLYPDSVSKHCETSESERPTGVSPAEGGYWSQLSSIILNHRLVIILLTVCILAFGLPGLSYLRSEFRAVEMLPRKSSVRPIFEGLQDAYGGFNFTKIEIDSGRPDGVLNVPFLKFASEVHRFAERQSEVTGVYSYPMVLAVMNQIWEGGGESDFSLPDNPVMLKLFQLTLDAQNLPQVSLLRDSEKQSAFLYLRTRDLPDHRLLETVRAVVEFGNKIRPETFSITAKEGIHSILEAERSITCVLRRSVLLTFLAIGILLTFLWRSLLLSILVLLIIGIPTLLFLAIAGFASIPLNAVTSMLGAVVLGIAVDDVVHFVTYWRQAGNSQISTREALSETYSTKGPPILCTSIILIGIFALLALSSFPSICQFGAFAALALALTLPAVFLTLPSVLILTPRFSDARGARR